MDRRIKFRHLDAFVAIARAKSLKRGALQINLSQPAMSKTLKDLEDILATTLMERDRSGVRLTAQGEVFLQYAEQCIAALQHGLTNIESLGKGTAVPLSVGAMPSVAAQFLPEAMAEFRDISPDTVLHIEEGPHSFLVDRLRRGALDLAVGRLGLPETMVGLTFTQLYSESVVFAVAPDHPLGRKPDLTTINDHLVVYPPKDAAIRPLVARFLISQGVALFDRRIESTSMAIGRALALGPGRAVWVISRGVVAADVAAGHLTILDIDTAPTAGPVGIMSRADADLSAAARLFSRILKDRGEAHGNPAGL